MEWTEWHKQYETSLVLLARLRIVREQIRAFLGECGAGPVRIVSICSGDGRDLIEALSDHPRRDDVTAWLLDTDQASVDRGRAAAAAAGLQMQVFFFCSDASLACGYHGIVPADLVIVSGVLGHLGNAGISRFLGNLPMLCKSGGSVIWNRHLVSNEGARDVAEIRRKLQPLGFEEVHYSVTSRNGFAVGRFRFRGVTAPFDPQHVIFEFIGLDHLSPPQRAADNPVLEATDRQASVSENIRLGTSFISKAEVEQSLPSCFERRAALHPHRTALGSGSWQPSYQELNNMANRLAHALLPRGTRGGRVALLMQHDTPLIGAMLGVLKAGRIVVVLNATDPAARLAKVLDDAGPDAILTDPAYMDLAARIAGSDRGVICVEEHLAGKAASNPNVSVSAGDVAFLVYTSGSTGPPKGVMQSHRSILHKVFRVSRALELQTTDRILLSASLSGGQGVNTTWCALAAGATVCPFPMMTRGVTGLASWMADHGITVYVSAASVFRHFARTLDDSTRVHGIRLLWLASEPALSEDVAFFHKHFPDGCILYHTLASSETGVITQLSFNKRDPVPQGRLPIGRPVEDMEVLLLDEDGREVPHGETGEIAVKSRYLFTGYWRDDALTAQRLTENGGSDGVKIFRTGDRSRLSTSGQLVFMGRLDTRVNIHGYRVELSEIEDALSQEPSIEKAVVSAFERPSGNVQLVAYVALRPGRTNSGEALRQALRGTLPGHMIPAAYVFLESFPLTPHGKIDREALRKIAPTDPASKPLDVPATETEKLIAGAWSDVFERSSIGRADDFFELGGDSLTATVVAAMIYATLRVQVDLRMFAEHPTLAALASAVDELCASRPHVSMLPLERVSREEPLPLSYHQERTWKFSQTPEGSAGYTAASGHLIRGPLDVTLLRESMSYLGSRHESLRTTFAMIEGRPVQRVHPPVPEPLPLIDLAGTKDPEEQAAQIFREEARRPFDLACRPLMRFMLIRLREDENLLLRIGHHIIVDAWSWDVYFSELGLVYEAKLRGELPPLPEFEPLQYADYAVWQRRVMGPQSFAYEEEVSWWARQMAEPPMPLELPFRRPVPLQNVDPGEGTIKLDFDTATSSRLSQMAREQRATPFVVRLAAFVALLADESGQPDVILGTYVTNRNRVETQKMFGFFANMTTLRYRCDGRLTFREWTAMVGVLTSEFQARSEIPYEQLCEELRARGAVPPEIRVIVSMFELDTMRFGGLELSKLIPASEFMPWGITLIFRQGENRDTCTARFDANLYDHSGVRRFVSRLVQFLDRASCQPDLSVSTLLADLK